MFHELLRNVRFADLADILVVSALVYGVLILLRRSAPRALLIGAPLAAAAYVLALLLDMSLTLILFHAVLPVLLIGAIVLFQEDIRRALRRRPTPIWTGSLKWLRGGRVPPRTRPETDALVEAAFQLASRKVGALVVLVGREPLEPHVEGGVALNGRFSLPLLCSLFDPHSPGHDGAVLMEHQTVTRFAVHLPLSGNAEQVGDMGTRHSAALGLSERSDALVLVISEERGTVSVAEEGRIALMASAAELKDRIERFHAARLSHLLAERRKITPLRNWRLMLLSFLLACLGWFLFGYQPDLVERTFVVPIEYRNLPEGTSLDGTEPSEARVTLAGRESVFNLLDPATLVVSLDTTQEADAPRSRDGVQEIPITAADVRRPFRLTVTHISPDVARIRPERGR
jgi:diadenylate cyclase